MIFELLLMIIINVVLYSLFKGYTDHIERKTALEMKEFDRRVKLTILNDIINRATKRSK